MGPFSRFLSDGQGRSAPGHVNSEIPPEDAFVVDEDLPDVFVLAASNCLAFARDRQNLFGLLTRRNIVAVVSNGTPFLFKSALDCARRMRAFLGTDQGNASEYDKATTINLMKYIMSDAYNPTVSSSQNGLYSRELVDSSIQNLLHELGTVSGAPTGYAPAQEKQFSGRYGQMTRPFGRNIEMKRGDWVCSKSIIPRTINDDLGKPEMPDYENVQSSWTGKSLEGSAVKEPDPLDMSEEAKAERWFKRIVQIKDISELSQIPYEDVPSIMPMRRCEQVCSEQEENAP